MYPAAHSVTLGNPCTGKSADALAQWNESTPMSFVLYDMQFHLVDFVYCYYICQVPFDGYDESMVELFKNMPSKVEDQFDVKKYPLNPLMKLLFHFIQVRLRMLEPGQFEWP